MAETSTGSSGGLIAGLLSGSALCCVLIAGMSIVNPLPATRSQQAPSVDAVSDGPELSQSGTSEDETPAIAQTDAPIEDIALIAPTPEAPAADRDTQEVTLERPADQDPVQTGTAELNGPETTQSPIPETAANEPPAEVTTPEPLETAETNVEADTPDVVSAPGSPTNSQAEDTAPEVTTSLAPSAQQTIDVETVTASIDAPETDAPPSIATETAAAPNENSGPEAPAAIVLDETPGATPQAPVKPETNSDSESGSALTQAPSQDSSPSIDTAPSENTIVFAEPETAPETPEQPEDEPAPSPEEKPEPPVEVATDAAPAAPEFGGNAFAEFAVAYQAPDDGPFLTIILEDVGAEGVSLEDLKTFGAAITYAIPTGAERSRWREAAIRDAGFEVVALAVDEDGALFSQNSVAEDISELVSSALSEVPGAVALINPPAGDVYRNARLVSSLATELSETGRGLLFHEKFGVNRALEAANSTGIPSQSILRIIDENRDVANIRRALDRASLDASKSGAAIVYGRTYPETVAAILPWLLSNSARSVNLAPLTATMKRADR